MKLFALERVIIRFRKNLAAVSKTVVLLFFALGMAFTQNLGHCQQPIQTESPLSSLENKTIRHIIIHVADIFDEPNLSWLFSTANDLKIATQEKVIRQELLFKEGDQYDEFLVNESKRALRALKYLRQVEITPLEEGDFIDLLVTVQDTWTIIPQLSFSSGLGRENFSVGAAESNLVGLGKRLELFYQEDEGREIVEGIYDDNRVLGSKHRLFTLLSSRSDGQIGIFQFARPFRSLVDNSAWDVTGDISDTVGRLFADGDERYIYRLDKTEFDGRYTIARGNPEILLHRYSFGYSYQENVFEQADADDYEDLDLNPQEVSNDPAQLADDRRFSGPTFAYQQLRPDYISMAYIDRFERVEDYNLGDEIFFSAFLAPQFLGSRDDALLLTGNRSRGWRFETDSFLRGELGVSSRLSEGDIENSVLRAELRYYNVFGPLSFRGYYLGKHTLAASMFLDYGEDLDKDREFLIGGDNSIRGYEAKTFTGDKRISLNVEQRAHFIEDWLKLVSVGGVVFFDAGGATRDSLGELLSDDLYADVGIGLRFAFPRASGSRVVRVDLALPLRDGPDGSDQYQLRVIFSGGQLFNSRLRSETLGPQEASVGIGFDR